jgi:hypothetical protein
MARSSGRDGEGAVIGWLILAVYIVGLLVTWIASYGILYRNEKDKFMGPIEIILIMGFLSFILALFWPFVVVIFGIHRIATRHVGGGER